MNIGLISHEVLETAQHITITGFSDIAHYLIASGYFYLFMSCTRVSYWKGKNQILYYRCHCRNFTSRTSHITDI